MHEPFVIVGGGAAGCFAACIASAAGVPVLVLDANDRLMHKLSITGKGRCNVTNHCDLDTLMQHVNRNPRFLYSAFSRCLPEDVMRFFTARGVPLKTERGRRVFPESDKAKDICDCLLRTMEQNGVEHRLHANVRSLILRDGICCGVRLAGGEEIAASSVLVTTGGMSYPRTGSRGGGYRLAEQAGHTVNSPQPALIPLETAETDIREMQGLSLRNVTLRVTRGKKTVYSELGEMLFTHFGVSGPLVLTASCLMEPQKLSEYTLHIDLKPALDDQTLHARILRDLEPQPNRQMANALSSLLPASMIPVMLRRAQIDPASKVHDLTRVQRSSLVQCMKDFTLHPSAMRPISEAIITRGGISVKEIDPNTMGSKLIQNLYFAGEVLDVDAFTGGYNLQIAFATAHAAAKAVSEKEALSHGLR